MPQLSDAECGEVSPKVNYSTFRRCIWLGVWLVAPVLVVTQRALAQEAPPHDEGGFVDVAGNTHEEDIRYIVTRGLTVGCDHTGLRYCPDHPVTRAQIATFLARALRLDTTVPYLGVYSDVEEGVWYTPYVEALGAHGFTDTQVLGGY